MMHSGGGSIALKHNPAVSVYIGIASLVLEGRVVSTDDDDTFSSIKFDSTQTQFAVENSKIEKTKRSNSSQDHGVIHRISEKLMRLRQLPCNKEAEEASLLVPFSLNDDYKYERPTARLHHVASAREFQCSSRLTNFPSSSASNFSPAASIFHDIDVDWNDISILFNGLDSFTNIPGSPLKIHSNAPFMSSLKNLPNHLLNNETATKMKIGDKMTSKQISIPKQGPHCENFLKKIGLLKLDSIETDSDHMCNHVNNNCRRWQLHLKMLLQILSRGEDACIEVYLGPETNAILLEQWLFQLTENPSLSTMTVTALCNAIRSQLFFSQVSSWADLLRQAFDKGTENGRESKTYLLNPEIMQNPRLKKNLETMQVDLDILFKIKPFEGIAVFNEKPVVHIFPDTMVSEKVALRICLKSLPRLTKIPTLNTEKANSNGFTCDNRIKTSSLESTSAGPSHFLNDRLKFLSCHEKGKHRCKDDDDEEFELLEEKKPSSANISSTMSHRERQLQKYKKRIMKRDKQKKKNTDNNQSKENMNEMDVFENFPDLPAINDTFAPLYAENPTVLKTETNSIATQTDDLKCSTCGDNLRCDSCDKPKEKTDQKVDKAYLLLQAIQRTADAHLSESSDKSNENLYLCHNTVTEFNKLSENDPVRNINNNNNIPTNKEVNDCRLCKKQKTKHNYSPSIANTNLLRNSMSECIFESKLNEHRKNDQDLNKNSKSCDETNTIFPMTSHEEFYHLCSDDRISKFHKETCCEEKEGNIDSHFRNNTIEDNKKLPTPYVGLQNFPTCSSTSSIKEPFINKNQTLPKINLSKVFDEIKDDSGIVQDLNSPTSDAVFIMSPSSYPPTSMQSSPKFIQSSNFALKHRSRHFSDRSSMSEISNLSDEDEDTTKDETSDTDSFFTSNKISSFYKKIVTKGRTTFNKLPLLSTIEGSLLHNRFEPKKTVNGFKLLLGASGSFCPTQLTITAKTFFYEFQGLNHMSTPYVSECQLSRKGYSIPRQGTVQATLLNPQGTVVRMFFVPYDFRDMPSMCQTFIRQRVLAIDENVDQNDVEKMSTVEQMKHLRYVLHLRFQTGRNGRLCLHTDIKMVVFRRTELDTAQAHAKNSLESPNDLKTVTICPDNPKFSSRFEKI